MDHVNNINSSIAVIIVEDNPKYQKILEKIIECDESIKLLAIYNSAESFLQLYPKLNEKPAILLLDIELPKMSGIELIPILKKDLSECKILIISQFDNDNNIFNAMTTGANGYLLKTSSIDEILKAIHDINIGISAMSPYIASRILEMFKEQAQPRKNYHLSHQELNVLQEIVNGLSKQKIADKLFISYHTVDSHIRNIYQKLNVHNQVNLVSKTIREHLL